MAALTIEETKVLTEFRKRVSDVIKTKEQNEDTFLIRWLRARDLDLNKAEEMLRKSMVWREENNVDKAQLGEFDSFFIDEYPFKMLGHDKIGNPIALCPIGKWDLRKITRIGKTEEFKLYINSIFETFMQHIRERNQNRDSEKLPITQITILADWGGYSYMQLVNIKAVQQILNIAAVYEAHYPEILCKCFFVNCPSFFNILLAMLKPILAPKTLGKMTCYGYNKSEWEIAVHETIEPEQLQLCLDYLNL